MSFYTNLQIQKKNRKLTNADIGNIISMSGDAFRMAIKRESLNELEKNTIENYFASNSNTIEKKAEKQLELYIHEGIMNVPLVNQYAYAGYMNGFNDPEFIEELPKVPFLVEKEHKGEYICFEVKGDSMDNGTHESYLERDILLCRNVRKDFWKSKLHINKWDFVIVDKNNGILVKRIINHDVENGIITCHSLNDYYEDFDIDLRNVSQIFNIVDIQRKRNRR